MLPTAASHPFYARLNQLLRDHAAVAIRAPDDVRQDGHALFVVPAMDDVLQQVAVTTAWHSPS